MNIRRMLLFIIVGVGIFGASFFATFMLKDPVIDMSKYTDVIQSHQEKIKELHVSMFLIKDPMYRHIRGNEGLRRLEALADDGLNGAIESIYLYYAKPEYFNCTLKNKNCPPTHQAFDEQTTANAFKWAYKLEGSKRINALAHLIRDWRFAPMATEQDRIELMRATEGSTRSSMHASAALAYHYLDKRYFMGDMLDESFIWLERAIEIEQNL